MLRILIVVFTVLLLPSRIVIAQPTAAANQELMRANPVEVGMSAEKIAKIVPVLQQFVDDRKIAGAIVIVARKGRVVLFDSVGWRDLEADQPMEKDSILRFYSMTKPVTSVATMMLVEEGKLGLDDPVSRYVPELAGVQVFEKLVAGERKCDPGTTTDDDSRFVTTYIGADLWLFW